MAELLNRDKASLDVFWLKGKSLTDSDKLPDPDNLAEEIIAELEAGLLSFRGVLDELGNRSNILARWCFMGVVAELTPDA